MIDELRERIDSIDARIAILLAARSRAVADIRAARVVAGVPRRDLDREERIVARVAAIMREHHGRYDARTVQEAYRAIFEGCERLVEEASVSHPVDDGDPRPSAQRA